MLPFGEAWTGSVIHKRSDTLNACGEVETVHPGYLGSQDTFYVGALKGVGRVYQQTYVDTYCKVAHAKLYTALAMQFAQTSPQCLAKLVSDADPDLQRFLLDPFVYLAPNSSLRVCMSAGVPLDFTIGFDTPVKR